MIAMVLFAFVSLELHQSFALSQIFSSTFFIQPVVGASGYFLKSSSKTSAQQLLLKPS